MLRGNLSTRPFYNERAVHFAIGVAAVLLVALTAWNVISVLSLSRQSTELATRTNRDHAEAQQLVKMAADVRGRVDEAELRYVAAAAREANSLIDQRTFSWTSFFNRLESTMPPDVMLTAVRPFIKDGTTRVSMAVLARRAEDVDEFIEKLEASGAFEQVVPAQTDRTEQGLYRVALESLYTGEDAPADTDPDKKETDPNAAPAERDSGGAR